MLKELLDGLINLGNDARKAKVHKIDGDPYRVFIEHRDGRLEERVLPPLDRKHNVQTLFDLMKAAKHTFAAAPVIWHNEGGVILLLDDGNRHDLVTLRLGLSPAYVALADLSKQVAAGNHLGFQPKELVRFFRLKLAGCVYDRAFVNNLRKIKWKTAEEVRQTMSAQGKESLGRDIEAELQTDVPLPEEIEVEIPVYSTPDEDEQYTVKCLIEVDAIDKKIWFLPEPGSLEAALQSKQKDIRETLEKTLANEVPIFQGTP